jgi:Tfp pilus assembly protein PilF
MFKQAKDALDNKQYEEAIQLFLEIIKTDSQNALAHADLAMALYKSKRWDEARKSCDDALSLDPNTPIPHVVLAYLSYLENKDNDLCYQFAKTAYDLAPELPETLSCFGFALLLRNETEQAVPLLEKALPLSTAQWEIRNNLSIAYRKLGQFDKTFYETLYLLKHKRSVHLIARLVTSFLAMKQLRYPTIIILSICLLGGVFGLVNLLIVPIVYLSIAIMLGGYGIFQKETRSTSVSIVLISLLLFILVILIFQSQV